jgi:hypothetical protein
MTTPQPLRLTGRVPKRRRTLDELAELAARLCSDWRPGDNVMTWIRLHEGARTELSRLVREGWSWDDIGRALDVAGIRYQTGKSMAGDLLRKKAGRARADERKRLARESQIAGLPIMVESASSIGFPTNQKNPIPALSPAASVDSDENVEPGFKPAVLIGWSGKTLADRENALPRIAASAPSPSGDVDAVLSRLLGKN